jgi:hypothetical protein
MKYQREHPVYRKKKNMIRNIPLRVYDIICIMTESIPIMYTRYMPVLCICICIVKLASRVLEAQSSGFESQRGHLFFGISPPGRTKKIGIDVFLYN